MRDKISELETTDSSEDARSNVDEKTVEAIDDLEENIKKRADESVQEEQIEILEKTIAGLSSAKDEAHLNFREMEETYQRQLAEKTEELHVERNKRSEMDVEINQLNADMQHLEASLLTKDQELQCLKERENFRDDSEILKLNEEMRQLRSRCDQLNETVHEVECQNDKMSVQIGLWKEKCINKEHEKEAQNQDLMAFIVSLTKSNSPVLGDENGCDDNATLVNKLKQHITKKEEEIDNLITKIKNRDDEIRSLRETSESLLEKLEDKENKLHSESELCKKQQQDVVNSKTMLESLSAKLLEKSEECQQFATKLENEQRTLRNLEERCRTLEELVEEKDRHLVSTTENALFEKEHLMSLQQSVDKAQQEGEKKDKLSLDLHATVAKQTNDIKQLKDEIISLNKTILVKEQDLAQQTKTSNSQVQELSEKLSLQENECNKLREQIESRNAEINTLKTNLQTTEKEFNELLKISKDQVHDMSKKLKSQNNEYLKLEDLLNMRNEEIKVTSQRVSELELLVFQKEKQLDELKEVKENAEQRETYIKDELMKKEQELQTSAVKENNLLETIRSCEETVREKEKMLEELIQDIERHSNEKVELEEEINRLREHTNTFAVDTKAYEETIGRHEKNIEETRASKGEKFNQIQMLSWRTIFDHA